MPTDNDEALPGASIRGGLICSMGLVNHLGLERVAFGERQTADLRNHVNRQYFLKHLLRCFNRIQPRRSFCAFFIDEMTHLCYNFFAAKVLSATM